jgi:uncharacterized protein YgiM (DUF1202 family)
MPTNDPRANDNWRLEEGGRDDDKWLLRESEQTLTDQWSLQETDPVDPISSWQPVEYVKEPRRSTAWVLPTIITLALLVTLGYAVYRILPEVFGLASEAEPTPVDQAIVAEVTTTPAEGTPVAAGEPAVTPEAPAQPTPQQQVAPPPAEPTPTTAAPTNLVTQDFATVNTEFGVNARSSPSVEAPIIRLLENGETLFVFGQQGEWLEVFVADTPLSEGQAFSGTVGYAAADFFDVSAREITVQLQNEVLAYAGKLPTPTAEPVAQATPADAAPVGATTPTTGTTEVGQLTVTVNAIYGVNVRRAPATTDEANIMRLLDNNTVLPAIGRTADTLWIQVRLPDQVDGWIAAEFLVPSADLTTQPVVGADGAAGPTTQTITSTTAVTSSTIVPPAPYTNVVPTDGSPAIIVTVVDGVNARSAPALDAEVEAVVPQGAVLAATGRSSDSQWVEVTLPTGVSAWIFRDTVVPVGAVGALPATDSGLAPTPEPTFELVLLPTPTPTTGVEAADTPEPAATATPEPTTAPAAPATPAPTATTESTPESTPESTTESTTVTAEVVPFALSLYDEPDSEAAMVAQARRGADFVVTGRTTDGSWLQVTTADGTIGWVRAGNVQVTGDIGTVPVVP